MKYSTGLFEARTIRRMLSHLETIARAAVADPDRSIETLPLLTPAEHARQVLEWNDTGRVYPRNVTVRERFERRPCAHRV